MKLNDNIKDEIREHANKTLPEECCGFLVESEDGVIKVFKCENIAKDRKNFFKISVDEYLDALVEGDISAVYHSHTIEGESFSDIDKHVCDNLEMVSVLYNTKTNEFEILEPTCDE